MTETNSSSVFARFADGSMAVLGESPEGGPEWSVFDPVENSDDPMRPRPFADTQAAEWGRSFRSHLPPELVSFGVLPI